MPDKQTTIQDDKIAFTLRASANSLTGELVDKATGRVWGPAPLLAMEVHEAALRRDERLTRYQVEAIEENAHSLNVVVSDSDRCMTVGLRIVIAKGELVVRTSSAEVYESDTARFRLFAIDVLPGLLRVSGEGSRLLLPLNGAVLCHPAGKPRASDRWMIYLEQPRWELSSMLPLGGAWDQNGGVTLLATQAAPEAQARATTDGQGSGHFGFAFSFRRVWIDPVEGGDREIRFVPIPRGTDPVHFSAKRLRRHLIDDLKKKTLRDRAAESPEVKYLLSSMTIKLFHGMQNNGAAIYDRQGLPSTHLVSTMTFAEAAQALRELRDAGIPRLYTQSVGWNARGHDGLYPQRFPVEPRFGGEAGFHSMLAAGEALGYQCSVHDNFQMNTPSADNWSKDCIIHDMFGEPLVRGWWAAGTEYATWPAALPEERLAGHLRKMKSLGIRGMYYCDYWIAPLECNYHPTCKGSRSAHQRGMEHVLSLVKSMFGSVGTEFGTLPGVAACDSIATHLPHGFEGVIRQQTDWPVSVMVDETVPIWALTCHGLTQHIAAGGPTWGNAVQSILWGATPRDEWGIRPIKMGGIHQYTPARAKALKALHDLCVDRFGHLVYEEMTSCVADKDGTRTRYSDGTVVEHSAGVLRVNGTIVERPPGLL